MSQQDLRTVLNKINQEINIPNKKLIYHDLRNGLSLNKPTAQELNKNHDLRNGLRKDNKILLKEYDLRHKLNNCKAVKDLRTIIKRKQQSTSFDVSPHCKVMKFTQNP